MNNCYMRKTDIHTDYALVADEEYMYGADRIDAFTERLFAVLGVLAAFFARLCAAPTVRRVLRYAGVALCFFCFLGLVGGIEQGLISAGLGVVVGLLLIFVEILCLR